MVAETTKQIFGFISCEYFIINDSLKFVSNDIIFGRFEFHGYQYGAIDIYI